MTFWFGYMCGLSTIILLGVLLAPTNRGGYQPTKTPVNIIPPSKRGFTEGYVKKGGQNSPPTTPRPAPPKPYPRNTNDPT